MPDASGRCGNCDSVRLQVRLGTLAIRRRVRKLDGAAFKEMTTRSRIGWTISTGDVEKSASKAWVWLSFASNAKRWNCGSTRTRMHN